MKPYQKFRRGSKPKPPPPPDGRLLDISINNRDLYYGVRMVHVPGRSNKWTPERSPETLAALANNIVAYLQHLREIGVNKFYIVGYTPFYCRDQIMSVIGARWGEDRDWGSVNEDGSYITYAAKVAA